MELHHRSDPPGFADLVPVLSRIGNKWGILVIILLGDGPRRFNELKNSIGVSQRMLTVTVRSLERDGLITRTVFPTIPPRVDYELTELGCSLLGPVRKLKAWAVAYMPEMQKAQNRFDTADATEGLSLRKLRTA